MVSPSSAFGALRICGRSSNSLLQLSQQFKTLRLAGVANTTRCYASFADTIDASESAIKAAPEIDFNDPKHGLKSREHARAVPTSPSYFSRQPLFTDEYLALQNLLKSYKNLPSLLPGQAERVAWKNLTDFRNDINEHVKASDFVKCTNIVKRLHRIHPKLKPPAVVEALKGFMKEIQPFGNLPAAIPIDKYGRALGVGKRKTSVARAWVVEGNGEVLINGKAISDAFGRVHDRESALWALKATARLDKYNVWALVEGGGTTGQAEALTLAIAKGLLAHEPALKPALRRAGCITRDSRIVERKKTGHVKARKSPTWVKR